MRQVDITRNLIFAVMYGPNEQDGSHAAIAQMCLALRKLFEEFVAFDGTSLVRKRFDLSGTFVFFGVLICLFLLLKLFSR